MLEESTESRNQWIAYQEYLIKLIKQTKYDALISKSMHITDYQSKISTEEKNNNVVFNYVKIPYSSLADSSFSSSNTLSAFSTSCVQFFVKRLSFI